MTLAQLQENVDYMRKAYRDLDKCTYGVLACFGKDSRQWNTHCDLLRLTLKDVYRAVDALQAGSKP